MNHSIHYHTQKNSILSHNIKLNKNKKLDNHIETFNNINPSQLTRTGKIKIKGEIIKKLNTDEYKKDTTKLVSYLITLRHYIVTNQILWAKNDEIYRGDTDAENLLTKIEEICIKLDLKYTEVLSLLVNRFPNRFHLFYRETPKRLKELLLEFDKTEALNITHDVQQWLKTQDINIHRANIVPDNHYTQMSEDEFDEHQSDTSDTASSSYERSSNSQESINNEQKNLTDIQIQRKVLKNAESFMKEITTILDPNDLNILRRNRKSKFHDEIKTQYETLIQDNDDESLNRKPPQIHLFEHFTNQIIIEHQICVMDPQSKILLDELLKKLSEPKNLDLKQKIHFLITLMYRYYYNSIGVKELFEQCQKLRLDFLHIVTIARSTGIQQLTLGLSQKDYDKICGQINDDYILSKIDLARPVSELILPKKIETPKELMYTEDQKNKLIYCPEMLANTINNGIKYFDYPEKSQETLQEKIDIIANWWSYYRIFENSGITETEEITATEINFRIDMLKELTNITYLYSTKPQIIANPTLKEAIKSLLISLFEQTGILNSTTTENEPSLNESEILHQKIYAIQATINNTINDIDGKIN